MTKRPSLAAAMADSDVRAAVPSVPTTSAIVEPAARRPATALQGQGRGGKKAVLGYFSPECKKQIKIMLAEQGKTEQDMLAEAINDLFAKYGKPTLA